MAHVEKRGPNRYRARYRTPDGRERSRTFAKKVDAERFVAQMQVDLVRGEWIDPRLGRLTFGAWVEDWKRTTVDLRDSTRNRQEGIVRNYLEPRFGGYPLARITTTDVGAFLAELRAEEKVSASGERSSKHSSASVRKVGQVLAQVLAAAVRAGKIPRSPCDGVKLPTELKRDMLFLCAADVAEVAGAIDVHYRVLVYTAAYTGLRWGELAGLRTENVNPLQRRLHVVEQMTEVAGVLKWGPPKTVAGRRTVTLPRFLADMLTDQIASVPSTVSGLVFPGPRAEPLRRSNFRRRWWTRATRTTGHNGLRFHDLRHTAVALAIAQGAHPKAIQERMGHSSITVTLDRYGHLFPALDEQIADGLDGAFAAANSHA